MTPYEIKLLLWYHVCPDGPPGDEPIRKETILQFVADGLLTVELQADGDLIRGTEKLAAYCDALCNVPLPIQKWVIP